MGVKQMHIGTNTPHCSNWQDSHSAYMREEIEEEMSRCLAAN